MNGDQNLTLISLNIEGDNHLDKVLPFLKQQQPDLICLQEVYRHSLPELKQELAVTSSFVPICHDKDQQQQYVGLKGTAILTNLKTLTTKKVCYAGFDHVPNHQTGQCGPDAINRCLLSAAVVKNDSQKYQIATTHFTWAGQGGTNAAQRRDIKQLKQELDQLGEFVLVGDFNNPRGEEIYNQLAEWYTDEIPQEITTTIDGQFHRAGNLQLVVDGLFTTDHYQAKNVEVLGGVSDHKAISAKISKME